MTRKSRVWVFNGPSGRAREVLTYRIAVRFLLRFVTRFALSAAILILVLQTTSGVLMAQARDSSGLIDGATLGGYVLDENDRPLAHAVVSLPAIQRTTLTNDAGRFLFRALPSTEFVLEVRRLGYQSSSRRVNLAKERDVTLTFRIARAAVTVDQVTVTGSATASERRGAQDVAALDETALRASSTGSLGKTLEKLPGVSNMSSGPAAGNPVLRGLSQSRIRIVRDGVPQENFEASPRWSPPGNLSSVDRIEVVRGPASILYGSSALGGAINIIPRALPITDTGGFRLLGLVETQYFSNNDERYAHGEISGAEGPFGVRAGGALRVAGDFHTPSVAPYAESQLAGAPRIAGRVKYSNFEQASGYAQIGVAGSWGQLRVLYDGWSGFNNFPNANETPVGVHSRNNDVRLQGTLVRKSFVVKPSVVVQHVLIERAATVARTFEAAADSNLWDQRLVNRVVTSRVEVSQPTIAGFRGTVGAEFANQHAVTRLSQIQPTGSISNAAAFLFEEYHVRRITLSGALRGDIREQRATSSALLDTAGASARSRLLHQQFHVVTGSLGAAYQLTAPLSASVNWSSGFRVPSFLDLYTNENRPALRGWVEGNPYARPERARNVEGGVHYTSNRIAGDVVVYHNSIANFTYLEKSAKMHLLNGTPLPVFSTQQTLGRLTGVEFNLSAEIVRTITVDASYAHVGSRNVRTGEQLPLMPADQLRSSLRYTRVKAGRFEHAYLQLGAKHAWQKKVAGPTEPFADGGSQGFGVASTSPYTLLDAGLGGRLSLGASVVELHFTVDNLLNEPFRDFLDSQKGFTLGQGRNIGLRVAVPLVFKR